MKLEKRKGIIGGENNPLNIVPYLPPPNGYFYDSRHWVYDTLDGILPFSVTTRISANNQQFLLTYEETWRNTGETHIIHYHKFLRGGAWTNELSNGSALPQRRSDIDFWEMRVLCYDDYNAVLPPKEKQGIFGTITNETGNKALRHNWKLILVYEQWDYLSCRNGWLDNRQKKFQRRHDSHDAVAVLFQ